MNKLSDLFDQQDFSIIRKKIPDNHEDSWKYSPGVGGIGVKIKYLFGYPK